MRLHPKYGANPTIPQCFLCGEDKNEIALLGAAFRGEAPMHMCLDKSPCEKCQGYMKQGVIFISVRNGEQESKDPYRTGAWCVIRAEAISRLPVDEATREQLLRSRVTFVEDSTWDKLGLPREEIPEKDESDNGK